MNNRIFRAAALFLLLLALLGPARAQTPDDSPSPSPELFKAEQGQIRVLDKFKRPYVFPRGTAWVGVRLDMQAEEMNPAVKDYDVLSADGVDYDVKEDADYVKFAVDDNGVANVKMVAFADPARNPVIYQLVFLHKDGAKDVSIPLSDTGWRAGDPQTVGSRTLMTPRDRAPNQGWEWALLVGFALSGLVLAYMLYGRSLFERMLRVKRMEVTTALGYSNLMLVLGLLLVLFCSLGLFFFPKILWGKQVMIYLVVGGGGLAALAVGYGAGLVMTKN